MLPDAPPTPPPADVPELPLTEGGVPRLFSGALAAQAESQHSAEHVAKC
jgi:hypothetical protein